MYQLNNENFNWYQVLTFSFCHKANPFHLLNNIAFFILISSQLEMLIGYKLINLILLTIMINLIGVNLIPLDGNVLGLSSIVYSTMIYFLLSKNNLELSLNFGLKFVFLLFILQNFIVLLLGVSNNTYNSDFYSEYLHFLGLISGLLLFLFYKTKKLIKR
jgi:membrane associated rhomboid family serine protease